MRSLGAACAVVLCACSHPPPSPVVAAPPPVVAAPPPAVRPPRLAIVPPPPKTKTVVDEYAEDLASLRPRIHGRLADPALAVEYLGRVHGRLHQLWGFGMLEEWDTRPPSSPFNDPRLVTGIELVLNGDGSLASAYIFRSSRLLAYDVAAIDVVYSAAPFPAPPPDILSADGKVYIDWRFHRNKRQCSTPGADLYIVGGPAGSGDERAFGTLSEAARRQSEEFSKTVLERRRQWNQTHSR